MNFLKIIFLACWFGFVIIPEPIEEPAIPEPVVVLEA